MNVAPWIAQAQQRFATDEALALARDLAAETWYVWANPMEPDPYKPPAAPPDPWVKLTWYRGLILSFLPMLVLRSFVTNETARTGLFVLAAVVLAVGIVQAAGYICPICAGRFTQLKQKTALLGALPALVTVAYGVLTRASCKSCGARVGESGPIR